MGKNVEKVHEASTNKDGVRLETLYLCRPLMWYILAHFYYRIET